ncbi:MAG: PAS domain S-box protein [Verrucomicrobiia bacterium]
MNAPREIQILHLEDRATEAELVVRELKREGIAFDMKRVWTEADFTAGLKSPALDLILADYALPTYDGLSALKLAHKERPEVPFVLVSGTLGEEIAIEALRDGATDYVLKQRLNRLGPAVRRALKEAQEQKQLVRMDQQLRLGEERLRLALEAGQTGAWEFDMVSGASWRTPRCDQIFGYSSPPSEWNYEIFLKHVVPEDIERVKRSFAQALSADRLSLECRIARTGQEPHWIAIQGRVSRNIEGECIRLMGTVSDISERKLMEKALRESEQHFRLLADNASDVIWALDTSGRLNYVSPSVQRLLGYSAEEILSLEWEQLLVAASAALARKKMDEIIPKMQAGERAPEILELNFIHKDGWTVWCDVSYSGMFDSSGEFVGIVGVSHDITERKQAIESQMRLVTALEQAEETIVITDVQGTIFYVNPTFGRITGYTRQEAIGQNPRILKSGKQDAAFYRQMWDTLSRGEVWHGHFINKKKDGTFFEENATISPVRDGTGRIVNYIALKLDVTHELELESQLRQSQKLEAIGTLAGGIAHEINNPVNGIMNYAQLITDQLPADHPVRGYAAKIMKETDRVSLIVRNLLAFARQGKQDRSPANLNDIIDATLTLIQAVIRHDQINLVVEVPEGLPQMECRSQQIEQVLMNLLTNARDALNEKYPAYHEDKIIRISARLFEKSGKPWIRTTVEDHGNGIPAEIRDRIFDPFYTTKPTGKGTGLGLSISHGLVEEHGGKLFLETEAGRHTRFHMDLPVKGEDPL